MSGDLHRFKIEKLHIKSKANKIFHLFKPIEPVASEEFDLGLTIANLNQDTYKNGYVSCTLKYASADVLPIELMFPFDTIRPNEEKELWLTGQTAFSPGPVLLHNFNLICDGKLVARGDFKRGSTIRCHSFINSVGQAIDKENPLIFNVASRDELYQKYSGVVAIWTAIISIIALWINPNIYFAIIIIVNPWSPIGSRSTRNSSAEANLSST